MREQMLMVLLLILSIAILIGGLYLLGWANMQESVMAGQLPLQELYYV